MNFVFISCLFSQTGWHSYSFSSVSSTSEYITKPSFVNADVGYVVYGEASTNKTIHLYRTTNKGFSWAGVNTPQPPTFSTGFPTTYFLDYNTGFIVTAYLNSNVYDINLIRTTDAGSHWCSNNGANWCSFSFIDNVDNSGFVLNPHVDFINANTGFIWFEKGILRTTDAGANWNIILSSFGVSNGGILKRLLIDKNNTNVLYAIGGQGMGGFDGTPIVYKSTNQGTNFSVLASGSSTQNGVTGIFDAALLSSDNLLFATTTGVSKYQSGTFATLSEPEPHQYYDYLKITGQENKAILYLYNRADPNAQNKVFRSDNSGATWSEDYDFIKRVDDMSNIGSVMNFVAHDNTNTSASHKNFFHVKEMSISSQLLYDNIPQSSSLPFYINDLTGLETTTIPGSNPLLGGTMYYNIGSNTLLSNPERKFYKWQNGETHSSSSDYIVDENYNIKAQYKTKNISTDNTAISKANSTKSLKEAHGNIDRVHTSLGGVFFSRSTNNGSTFSQEEVVNDNWGSGASSYATMNNTNPHIAEVKTILSGGVDATKNSAIVWERREGNNIHIMYSQREVISTVGSWHMDGIGLSGSNSFTVDVTGYPNFQCNPKLSVIKSTSNSDIYFTVITYLKPDGTSNKLMARVLVPGQNAVERVVSAGNISDFAIHSKPKTSGNGHDIYYAFLRDNHVYYKNINFYIYGSSFVTDSTSQTKISGGDGAITFRYSPDISLRNNLPVITYQGKYTIARAYELDGSTGLSQATIVNLNYYPIVVKYATSNTTWSNFIMYNSDGVSTQQNPNIEGCTNANAYMLNFSKSNTQFKHFVKGDNLQQYYCEPSTFTGADVKLVRGSYTSATGGAIRTTLSPSNSLFALGESPIIVTNSNSQAQDNAYGNIKGVINLNSTDYVFNLGPIIIQSGQQELQEINSLDEVPPITSGVEFNEYMTSSPFTLHSGDTLILGTSGFYKENKSVTFEPIVYRVNLINAATNEIDRELFNDTIHVEDENITEYYRGYVMGEIEGDLSCYVQIHVEGLEGKDAIYTLSGVYDGDEPTEGDNLAAGRIYVDLVNSGSLSGNVNIKPTSYNLAQNFPNPFNPTTTIRYSIPNDGLVQIKIYDLSGKEVMNLVNENKVAGNYEVKFNGANLSSGIYFYRINVGEFVQTKRMVLVK